MPRRRNKKMMWRICSRQRKERYILSLIDDLLYAKELEIDDDNTIFISKENQKQIICENFYDFSDLTSNIEDIKKLQDITVIAVNRKNEEIEVTIEIEGGV